MPARQTIAVTRINKTRKNVEQSLRPTDFPYNKGGNL